MNTQPIRTRRSWPRLCRLLAAATTLVAGCVTTGDPNPALDAARSGYRALQGDAQVALLAPDEFARAGQALRAAEAAAARHEPQRTIDHLAYLARQRSAIAREATSTTMWRIVAGAAGGGKAAD